MNIPEFHKHHNWVLALVPGLPWQLLEHHVLQGLHEMQVHLGHLCLLQAHREVLPLVVALLYQLVRLCKFTKKACILWRGINSPDADLGGPCTPAILNKHQTCHSIEMKNLDLTNKKSGSGGKNRDHGPIGYKKK